MIFVIPLMFTSNEQLGLQDFEVSCDSVVMYADDKVEGKTFKPSSSLFA